MAAHNWNSSIGVGSLVVFLLQPFLVRRFALVLSCVRLGQGEDDLFLSEDLSVRYKK